MTTNDKAGLTGIKEDARGFVGKNPLIDKCKNGRARARFDIGCGINNPELLKFATWRHCIAYGQKADKVINHVKKGKLIRVFGWVVTEALLDEYYKPVIVDGDVKKREYLILYDLSVVDLQVEDDPQLAFFSDRN